MAAVASVAAEAAVATELAVAAALATALRRFKMRLFVAALPLQLAYCS